MSGSKTVTVKCCKNCKYYRVDPFQQPWEDGCPDYVCTKLLKDGSVSENDIKSVREDNYCKDYERRKG